VCQRCGKPIGEERLEAFPYVAYCIECQSLVERDQAFSAGA
jgi:RNA polymerase-binding transcription factor DksA